jgi:hypothetical protein
MIWKYDLKVTFENFFNSNHIRKVPKPGPHLWIGLDSYENFQSNKKKLKYYIDNPIEYRINKDFYRNKFNFEDLENQAVDLYLGCSHTFGVGHHWKHTWPFLVSQHTNNTVVNLGVPGSGIDISYINLKKYIDRFNVKNVFHFQPIYPRYYVYNGIHNTVSVTNKSTPYFNDNYKKESLVKNETIVFNHFRCVDAITGICLSKNVNYFHLYDWFNEDTLTVNYENYLTDIPARDLSHYPLSLVQMISKKFIEKVDELK